VTPLLDHQQSRSFVEERDAAIAALDASFASFHKLHTCWLAQARLERQAQALYAAAIDGRVAGIIGTSFLDPRVPRVR